MCLLNFFSKFVLFVTKHLFFDYSFSVTHRESCMAECDSSTRQKVAAQISNALKASNNFDYYRPSGDGVIDSALACCGGGPGLIPAISKSKRSDVSFST